MYEHIKDYEYDKFPLPHIARTINGELVFMPSDKLIAHCNSLSHPGFMTKQDIEKHRCFYRNCPYLRKLYRNPFWKKKQEIFTKAIREESYNNLAITNPGEYARRQELTAERKAKWQEGGVATIRELEKTYMERNNITEDQFLIVNVEPVGRSSRSYRIHYVSDKPYLDFEEYNNLALFIERKARLLVRLIRIKHPQGGYATIHDYLHRKKWK